MDRPGAAAATGRRDLDLERIARAAVGEYRPEQAMRVVAEEAHAALDCDQAFVVTPAPRSDTVCVQSAAPLRSGLSAGEVWVLGEEAPRMFERCFSHTDSTAEPYRSVAGVLRRADFTSWVGLPLHGGRPGRPLGLLGLASCRPDGHLRWSGSLRRVAAAAGEALAGNMLPPEEPDAVRADADYEHTQALGNLAFGISHALGNIFGAILGNLHFLADETSGGRRLELLERIESSAYAGAEMMSSLQGFVGPPASDLQQVDLSALAENVIGLTRRLCGDQGCELSADLRDGCVVWGHSAGLRECLVNVLFNALWAAGPGGAVMVSTETEPDGSCGLSVRDAGPGMGDEVRRRATEPFFSTRPGHRGLGLTVARGIAVSHRGRLTIHTEPGGTTVAVTIPTAPPGESRMTEQIMTDALQRARPQ